MDDDGLSLMDMWKLVMKKKIVASIVFGIITILSFCLILFVYNPLQSEYNASFTYYWYGIEDNKFANGTLFNQYEIISFENISLVQQSKEEYQNISAESISESIQLEMKDATYSISVAGRFFQNDVQAKSFLEDLIYLPYYNALHLKWDFTANLKGFNRAKKISTKLEYLENQIQLIIEGYQGMISYFGDISIDETNLSSLLRNAEVFSSNGLLEEYRYLAYQNAYMTKEEYETILQEQEALRTEQSLLRDRKAILLDSLKNIYTNSNGNTYMDTSITNYLNSLHTLDSRLMTIQETLSLMNSATLGNYNEQESEKFIKSLESYKSNLEVLTQEYTTSVQSILKENTRIYISPIRVQGRIGIFIAGLISILLGILFGIAGAFLWAYIENLRKTKEI